MPLWAFVGDCRLCRETDLDIIYDHRNLEYIFSPVACATTLSKSTSHRSLKRCSFISDFSYVIYHIPVCGE